MGNVELKDVVKYLELNKLRAELSFQEQLKKGDEGQELRGRLSSAQKHADELAKRMETAGIVLAIPNELEIARLNEALSGSTASDILAAMMSREGEVWEKLAERGKLIKRNFENRENIAKLAIMVSKAGKDVRTAIVDAVRRGGIDQPVPLINMESALSARIAAVLYRLGIPAHVEEGSLCSGEGCPQMKMELPTRTVWVSPQVHEQLKQNLAKLEGVSSKIQLKNAVRQIKQFTDEEEQEFAQMQNDYLKLLKEQDELIKDFLEEEKITATVS